VVVVVLLTHFGVPPAQAVGVAVVEMGMESPLAPQQELPILVAAVEVVMGRRRLVVLALSSSKFPIHAQQHFLAVLHQAYPQLYLVTKSTP
jgi:hypothetical protein